MQNAPHLDWAMPYASHRSAVMGRNIAEAAADTPTKDEFDKLVTAFNTLAKQFDDTIAGLVSAGAVKLPDKK